MFYLADTTQFACSVTSHACKPLAATLTAVVQKTMIRKTIFLLFLLCLSCQKDSNSHIEKSTEKKPDSLNTIIGKISSCDTACLNQIKYADKQIKQGKLTYNLFMTQMSYGRQESELRELLKPYGIECKVFLTSCEGPEKGRRYCYANYMNQTIKNKFEKGFVDSLELRADRIFLTKNIDKVYHEMDEYDETIFYPSAKNFESQRDDLQKNFFSSFKYPDGFKFEPNRQAGRSIVEFTLYRNGQVKDITIDTEFEQNSNEKFIPYFENKLKNFVRSVKWIPRKQQGITVNGNLGFWIPYIQGSR